jgi:bifunctional oligoribonuclease and PAP phosphatase NrnA
MPSLKLLGRAIDGMKLECGGRMALLTLSHSDFQAAGAGPDQAEEIVNHGLMVPGVETSALLKEGRDRVFVSLRSRGKVDVAAVAARYGGGGHHNAAGCRIQEPLPKAALQIEAAMCSAIKQVFSDSPQKLS